MSNLIKILKETTLGEAVSPIKDKTLLETALSFTGVCGILQLSAALCAKLIGDREGADRNLSGAFLSLLINVLLRTYADGPDAADAAAAADEAADEA